MQICIALVVCDTYKQVYRCNDLFQAVLWKSGAGLPIDKQLRIVMIAMWIFGTCEWLKCQPSACVIVRILKVVSSLLPHSRREILYVYIAEADPHGRPL